MLTKFSKKELQEFEDLLRDKKEKAELQILDISDQLDAMSENGNDDASLDDSSAKVQQKEYLHNLKFRHQKHLRDIDNALIRIKNEIYGVCVITGQMIDKKRLIAVPTTTKSIEGKRQE
jgi:RNA polymerase-binding transcription factor DksA